jgi:hypothetical protein
MLTREDGGVLFITGVADGEGGANSGSSAGEGGANGESCSGANGESCAGEGDSGVGCVVRAGEGGVVLRGERTRASSSPPSLSSSASHRLLAAFLVRRQWRGVRGEIWRVLGPQGHGQRLLGYCLFV